MASSEYHIYIPYSSTASATRIMYKVSALTRIAQCESDPESIGQWHRSTVASPVYQRGFFKYGRHLIK